MLSGNRVNDEEILDVTLIPGSSIYNQMPPILSFHVIRPLALWTSWSLQPPCSTKTQSCPPSCHNKNTLQPQHRLQRCRRRCTQMVLLSPSHHQPRPYPPLHCSVTPSHHTASLPHAQVQPYGTARAPLIATQSRLNVMALPPHNLGEVSNVLYILLHFNFYFYYSLVSLTFRSLKNMYRMLLLLDTNGCITQELVPTG